MYTKKLLTRDELAGKILSLLASEPVIDNSIIPLVEGLPEEVRRAFFEMLEDEQKRDFQSKMFFIGTGTRDSSPEERANLRKVWELLESRQSPGP
jgi:hypothetical protein